MLFWTKEHNNIFFILNFGLKSSYNLLLCKIFSISCYKNYYVVRLKLRIVSSRNGNAGFKDLLAEE